MKKTLTMLGTGACVLLAFPACQSSKYSDGYEEATMASDVIGDNEIPDWLVEDYSDGPQMDAGDSTIRNTFSIPEPGETVADTHGSSYSSRQNQPDLAHQNTSDVTVEKPLATATDPIAAPPKPEKTASTATPKKPTAAKPRTSMKKPPKRTKPTMLIYKVRPGDNLSDIAKRSRTTVAQIKRDSGLKSDVIHPGQVIKVRYTPKGYKPGKTDKKNAGKTTTKGKIHVVARGETISGIAKKYGIPYRQIMEANGMSNADAMKIRPGKRLTIPGKKRN